MTRTLTAVAVVALAATGCTSTPDPELPADLPTNTQTTTTEADPVRAAEQAAIEAYITFNAVSNEVGQNYYRDYVDALDFTCDEYSEKMSQQYEALFVAGAHQVGEDTLSGFKVVDHQAVDNFPVDHHITFEVCIDGSATDVVRPDGSSHLDPGTAGRFVATVTMWHYDTSSLDKDAEPGGWWMVAGVKVDRKRPC
ncbi:MAG: hypothetical protein FWF02_14710 [Micrococcales bacterium]|nr:hypothetical protein [Micrococcales bacterium]